MHLARGLFLMPMDETLAAGRGSWRKALLLVMQNRGKTRRRFPSRAGGGFFPGFFAGREANVHLRACTALVTSSVEACLRAFARALRFAVARDKACERFCPAQRGCYEMTIVDYGAGNVPSVERALQRLGAESERTSSSDRISKAEALLLPGVGHYALWFAHSTNKICARL